MRFPKKSAALWLALAGLSGCAGTGAPKSDAVAALGPNPQVLLLGEIHDNAQGQRQRYEELRRRVEDGWRPAIAMEQFDRDSQSLLNDAQHGCLDAECVIRVAGGQGWDWQQYYPVIQLALTYQLPLIAVNLSRADASRVVRDGVAASFDAATVAEYHLAEPLPADIGRAQQQALQATHCHMLSEMMVGGMVNAQVARDIWMAKLLRAQRPRDVVLIAGDGHVRKDVGVPRWLKLADPALKMRSVGYVEEDEPIGTYDAVHKLAPQRRPDACTGLPQS